MYMLYARNSSTRANFFHKQASKQTNKQTMHTVSLLLLPNSKQARRVKGRRSPPPSPQKYKIRKTCTCTLRGKINNVRAKDFFLAKNQSVLYLS